MRWSPSGLVLWALLTLAVSPLSAQPDTLFVASGDSVYRYPVEYEPILETEQFKRRGWYAFDSTRTAVTLDYKRGRPSGVYRAYYPDGKPLVFAVYGWGSLHGDWTEYDEFGRVVVKGQYRDGQRSGTWAFRDQGIVGHYKDGLKHGKWKYYDRNDRLIRVEKYRQGELLPGHTYRMGPR